MEESTTETAPLNGASDEPLVGCRGRALVALSGLRFCPSGQSEPILKGVNLTVEEGEFVAVVGPNGAGKSTLARIIAGLEEHSAAARAVVCGADLGTAEGRRRARREVGILFQNPENQLLGERVEDDIAFGLENLTWEQAELRSRVDEMLARFRLGELARREAHSLSGGEKQRVALAGVLAIPRRLLVLDEPTTMLDGEGRREVWGEVLALRAAGTTTMLITQEMDQAAAASRIFALLNGACVFDGTPAEFFARPALLEELHLALPAATALARELAARGREFAAWPFTLDELVNALEER